jgi:hypothetical protein
MAHLILNCKAYYSIKFLYYEKNRSLINKVIRSLLAGFIALLYFNNLISGTIALVLGGICNNISNYKFC